jgi:transposase
MIGTSPCRRVILSATSLWYRRSSMVRVPTIAEEDAKRPNRERECLVKERTRLVNRMKGTLARLGVRNFRPTLRTAAEHLAALHTPEGSPLPPNVSAELERDIARSRLVIGQIKQIEEARRQRLEEQPERAPHAMVRWSPVGGELYCAPYP